MLRKQTYAFLGWMLFLVGSLISILFYSFSTLQQLHHEPDPLKKIQPTFLPGLTKKIRKNTTQKTGVAMVIRFLEVMNSATSNGSSTKSQKPFDGQFDSDGAGSSSKMVSKSKTSDGLAMDAGEISGPEKMEGKSQRIITKLMSLQNALDKLFVWKSWKNIIW